MNEKFVKDSQEVIKSICKNVCLDSSLVDDLSQHVSIYFLTHKLPENYVEGFIYSYAWKSYFLTGSEFRREHIQQNTSYLEDFIENIYITEDNIDKQYENVLKDLTDIERAWIEQLTKRNGSITLMSKHTKISKTKVKERKDSIFIKLRDNARD